MFGSVERSASCFREAGVKSLICEFGVGELEGKFWGSFARVEAKKGREA